MLLCRYAVFGLLDATTAGVVRPLQQRLTAITGNDLALRFPVHVTLRGRFWAERESVGNVLRELDLGDKPVGELSLHGPVFREPDLLWLSVKPECLATAGLSRLHDILTTAVNPVVIQEETSPAHVGSGYRPHVTLAWGADDATLRSLKPDHSHSTLAITATLEKVILAEYPATWPIAGAVAVIAELGRYQKADAGDVEESCSTPDGRSVDAT
jgi:hypothetical protein